MLGIEISNELHSKFKAKTALKGTNMSMVITKFIEKYVEDKNGK